MKARIIRNPVNDTIAFQIYRDGPDGRQFAEPITLSFRDHDEIGFHTAPTLEIPGDYGHEFLQSLADSLARLGVKPTDGHHLEGRLLATQYHLEDLREMLKLKPKE